MTILDTHRKQVAFNTLKPGECFFYKGNDYP